MRRCSWLVSLAAAVACAVALGAAAPPKPTITVLAAISLREALIELSRDFEASHGARVDLVFGASGQLAAQVEAGAPADVFVSAADAQVDRLVKATLADPASRRAIAGNTLVLIVPGGAKEAVRRFEDLTSTNVRRLAIGDPRSVPAGTYAMQALKHLKLDAAVTEKTILAANVRQVLDYVVRGEADAGIVYATDAASAGDEVRIVARADAAWHEPIRYTAVTVSGSKQPTLAARFVDSLSGEAGGAALRAEGFEVPATQPAAPATSHPTSSRSDGERQP